MEVIQKRELWTMIPEKESIHLNHENSQWTEIGPSLVEDKK